MNWKNLSFVFVAVNALAIPAGCREQTAGSLAARVDKLFSEWAKTNSPGFGVAVSRNGTLLFEHGYGMANLDLGVPITSASVFPVASISKQFTAMCILLLVERGQLSLHDEVKKFIPQWAYTEQPITIRHFLTHTSGLRDAFTLIGIAAPREDGVSVNDVIAAALARQRGLNFAPGSEFQYNNGAYNLLGTIVKRVSGRAIHGRKPVSNSPDPKAASWAMRGCTRLRAICCAGNRTSPRRAWAAGRFWPKCKNHWSLRPGAMKASTASDSSSDSIAACK